MVTCQTACEVPFEVDIVRRCQTNFASIQICSQNIVTSHILLHGVYQTSKASVDILLVRNCLTDIEVIARLIACLTFLDQLRQRYRNLIDIPAILMAFRYAVNRQKHFLRFTWFDFDKVVWQIRRHWAHGYDALKLVIFFSVKLCRINISEGNLLVFQFKIAAVRFKACEAAIIQFISQLGFQGIACVVV